jgi:hypothetical protein
VVHHRPYVLEAPLVEIVTEGPPIVLAHVGAVFPAKMRSFAPTGVEGCAAFHWLTAASDASSGAQSSLPEVGSS